MAADNPDVSYKDKLPWRQVLSLSASNFSQAVMLTTPFTIGVFMVRDFQAAQNGGHEAQVDEQQVGRLTGLLAGIFSFSGFLTAFAWGCASNYIGRKPVIVIGNAVSFVSLLWFGLAGSYGTAMAARSFGGFFNGILGAWKTMIGESTHVLLQGKFFGYMSLAWGLGCIAGPALGGAFARPCHHLPGLPGCGEGGLLAARPYFLACLIGCLPILAALIFSIVLLEETLPYAMRSKGLAATLRRHRRRMRKRHQQRRLLLLQGAARSDDPDQPGTCLAGRTKVVVEGGAPWGGSTADVEEGTAAAYNKYDKYSAGTDTDTEDTDHSADGDGVSHRGTRCSRHHDVGRNTSQQGGHNAKRKSSTAGEAADGADTDVDDVDDAARGSGRLRKSPDGGGSVGGGVRRNHERDGLLQQEAGEPSSPGGDGGVAGGGRLGRSGSLVRLRGLLRLASRTYIGGNPFASSPGRSGSFSQRLFGRVGSWRSQGGGGGECGGQPPWMAGEGVDTAVERAADETAGLLATCGAGSSDRTAAPAGGSPRSPRVTDGCLNRALRPPDASPDSSPATDARPPPISACSSGSSSGRNSASGDGGGNMNEDGSGRLAGGGGGGGKGEYGSWGSSSLTGSSGPVSAGSLVALAEPATAVPHSADVTASDGAANDDDVSSSGPDAAADSAGQSGTGTFSRGRRGGSEVEAETAGGGDHGGASRRGGGEGGDGGSTCVSARAPGDGPRCGESSRKAATLGSKTLEGSVRNSVGGIAAADASTATPHGVSYSRMPSERDALLSDVATPSYTAASPTWPSYNRISSNPWSASPLGDQLDTLLEDRTYHGGGGGGDAAGAGVAGGDGKACRSTDGSAWQGEALEVDARGSATAGQTCREDNGGRRAGGRSRQRDGGGGPAGGSARTSTSNADELEEVDLRYSNIAPYEAEGRRRSSGGGGGCGDQLEQEQAVKTAAAGLPWYRYPTVVLTILGYGLTALIFCALDEVFPIYASAPRESGGLGMTAAQVAPPLMFFGVVLMPYSLYGYPPLQRRMGTLRLTRVGLLVSVATCLLVPLVADLRSASTAFAMVTLYLAMLVKAFAQCSAFTGSIIAVNAAPSPKQLGAVNGVGQTLAALVRGVGPALGGVLWAASLGLHAPGQQFLTFALIAAVAFGNWMLYGFVRLPGMK